MFILRNFFFKKYTSSSVAATATGHVKISPAAYWHAKSLNISLEGIKGTGPKGHILKSDILQAKKTVSVSDIEATEVYSDDLSFLIEISSVPSDQVIKKCVESIKMLPMSQQVIKEMHYKSLPEIGFLQFELKTRTKDHKITSENIKNLLKMYLNDSSHLLL